MRPTRRRSGWVWPKSAGKPGALEVSGGPRSAVGPAARSAGTNPAEHRPRGRIRVEAGGSATPSPRGRTGPGRAPPEGYRGGRAGLGTGAPGPGSLVVVGRRGGDRGCAGAQQRGAAQGRSVGLSRGAAWGCAGAQRGAAQGRSSVGRRKGAAVWGCAAAQRGSAQGRSSVGLRRGAAWGREGALQRGAAQGRSVGLSRGAAWG